MLVAIGMMAAGLIAFAPAAEAGHGVPCPQDDDPSITCQLLSCHGVDCAVDGGEPVVETNVDFSIRRCRGQWHHISDDEVLNKVVTKPRGAPYTLDYSGYDYRDTDQGHEWEFVCQVDIGGIYATCTGGVDRDCILRAAGENREDGDCYYTGLATDTYCRTTPDYSGQSHQAGVAGSTFGIPHQAEVCGEAIGLNVPRHGIGLRDSDEDPATNCDYYHIDWSRHEGAFVEDLVKNTVEGLP